MQCCVIYDIIFCIFFLLPRIDALVEATHSHHPTPEELGLIREKFEKTNYENEAIQN